MALLGNQTSKAQVNSNLGGVCINLREAIDDIGNFSRWLVSIDDADLTDLGFDTGEITELRAKMSELIDLVYLWNGLPTLVTTPPFNYSNSAAEMFGAQ
jgi:hypothetical protein